MKKFEIIIGSPLEYKELVAYIWIDGEQIALVHQEEGSNNMQILFFEEKITTKLYLDDLLAALAQAKSELLK